MRHVVSTCLRQRGYRRYISAQLLSSGDAVRLTNPEDLPSRGTGVSFSHQSGLQDLSSYGGRRYLQLQMSSQT